MTSALTLQGHKLVLVGCSATGKVQARSNEQRLRIEYASDIAAQIAWLAIFIARRTFSRAVLEGYSSWRIPWASKGIYKFAWWVYYWWVLSGVLGEDYMGGGKWYYLARLSFAYHSLEITREKYWEYKKWNGVVGKGGVCRNLATSILFVQFIVVTKTSAEDE